MSKWIFAFLLALGAHFDASYIVPLDQKSQATFWGLLKWAWPWADGDHGPLGVMTVRGGFPVAGFFIAITAAGFFILAALAVVGWWVPAGWWRVCAIGGAALSIVLMALFFGPTKIVPILFDLLILWGVWTNRLHFIKH